MNKVSKTVLFGNEANESIIQGIDLVANVVKVTMGKRGQNVTFNYGKFPVSTKDGVSVARQINPEDPFMAMGAHMVIEAAMKTNELVGDGTTTCTVLTQALINEAMKRITKDTNVYKFQKGMEYAVSEVCKEMKKHAKTDIGYDEIKAIATISANNDEELGTLVADAFKMAGNALVLSDYSNQKVSYIDGCKGYMWNRGLATELFATEEGNYTCTLREPAVFISEEKINRFDEIAPIVMQCFDAKKDLLIVCDAIDSTILKLLINNMHASGGAWRCAVVFTPTHFGGINENIRDLGAVTGAKVYSRKDCQCEDDNVIYSTDGLGKAESVISNKINTKVICNTTDSKIAKLLEERLECVTEALKVEENHNKINELRERQVKLRGGAAVIMVGSDTEFNKIAKKDLIDDAIGSVNTALKSGYIPAGGRLLASAFNYRTTIKDLDTMNGLATVASAITQPHTTVYNHAGINVWDMKYTQADITECCIDIDTGEVVDAFDNGLIEPVEVSTVALTNAMSVAGTMITNGAAIHTMEIREGI